MLSPKAPPRDAVVWPERFSRECASIAGHATKTGTNKESSMREKGEGTEEARHCPPWTTRCHSKLSFPPGLRWGEKRHFTKMLNPAPKYYMLGEWIVRSVLGSNLHTCSSMVLAAPTITLPCAPTMIENKFSCTRIVPSCNHKRDE